MGASLSSIAKVLMLSCATSTSSFVQEICERKVSWAPSSARGGTHGLRADPRRRDVEPAGTHDLAVDDEELESAGVSAKDVTVALARGVRRNVGPLALGVPACPHRQLSCKARKEKEQRTWEVAGDFKPVGLLARDPFDVEDVPPLDPLRRADDVRRAESLRRIGDKVHFDVVKLGRLVVVVDLNSIAWRSKTLVSRGHRMKDESTHCQEPSHEEERRASA